MKGPKCCKYMKAGGEMVNTNLLCFSENNSYHPASGIQAAQNPFNYKRNLHYLSMVDY